MMEYPRDAEPRSDPSADQVERLVAALERIADRLDAMDSREAHEYALDRWAAGQGRHPDD